jgi:hypothetical protein
MTMLSRRIYQPKNIAITATGRACDINYVQNMCNLSHKKDLEKLLVMQLFVSFDMLPEGFFATGVTEYTLTTPSSSEE